MLWSVKCPGVLHGAAVCVGQGSAAGSQWQSPTSQASRLAIAICWCTFGRLLLWLCCAAVEVVSGGQPWLRVPGGVAPTACRTLKLQGTCRHVCVNYGAGGASIAGYDEAGA